jgi:segregation and condensation protein A
VLSPEQLVVPVVYGQQVPEEVVPLVDGGLEAVETGGFKVRLDNFEGPFDLLLQLIGKHKLDVTEVALHQVTDDFIAYIRAMGDEWDLGEASEFLLVAATLLDLKAARLLPSAEVEDEEDLALLEARDLLFARLLQYKAFKEAAAFISELEGTGAKRWPRAVSMEPRYAEALPDLVLGIGPERLFKLALKQFTPKPGPPEVSISHIHQVRVSVPEHARLLRERLRRAGSATFSLLVADCETTLEVVARFLALLELYRQNLIDFEQPVSLDELTVRWIGGDEAADELEIDDYEGSRPEPEAPPAESVTDADLADGELVLDDDPDDAELSGDAELVVVGGLGDDGELVDVGELRGDRELADDGAPVGDGGLAVVGESGDDGESADDGELAVVGELGDGRELADDGAPAGDREAADGGGVGDSGSGHDEDLPAGELGDEDRLTAGPSGGEPVAEEEIGESGQALGAEFDASGGEPEAGSDSADRGRGPLGVEGGDETAAEGDEATAVAGLDENNAGSAREAVVEEQP